MAQVPPDFMNPGLAAPDVPSISPPNSLGALDDMSGAPPLSLELPQQQEPEEIPKNYVPPPPMTDAEIEEIEEYVKNCCKASAEYVAQKLTDWDRFDKLYRDRLSFWDWIIPRDEDSTQTHDARPNRPAHLTDYVHSPKPLINTWASNLVTAVLEGPDWAVVEPLQENAVPEATDDYPTMFKLQQYLLQKIAEGRINTRLFTIATNGGVLGSVYGKIFLNSNTVSRWVQLEPPEDPLMDEFGELEEISPQYEEEETEVAGYPIIESIPLDKLLVDPKAKHNDIQRYRWIGHRVTKTYDEIEEAFQNGIYHANYEKFTELWDPEGGTHPEVDELGHDSDTDDLTGDDRTWIEAWEWHGKAPTKDGLKEIVVTILSDPPSGVYEADPADGIVVRALKGPVLPSGRRPFVCAHYTPQPAPFGSGLIEENEQLLWEISQLTCQFQDCVRLTTNFAINATAAAKKQISDASGTIAPGMVFEKDTDGSPGIEPVNMPTFPAGEIASMIQSKKLELESKSSQSDIFQGQSQREKTATESQILEQRGQQPTMVRAYIFAHDFMGPALSMALEMLQEASPDGTSILVRNQQGVQEPVEITADEMQGRYKVACTLTRQDQYRISQMQSIERVLQAIPNYLQIINQQGADVNLIELIKRWIDLLGIPGSDRIVHVYTPQEQLLIQENQTLQQQLTEMQAMLSGQAPPGPNGGPPPNQMPQAPMVGENGGPMGPEPTDANALMGEVQRMAQGQQQGF